MHLTCFVFRFEFHLEIYLGLGLGVKWHAKFIYNFSKVGNTAVTTDREFHVVMLAALLSNNFRAGNMDDRVALCIDRSQ